MFVMWSVSKNLIFTSLVVIVAATVKLKFNPEECGNAVEEVIHKLCTVNGTLCVNSWVYQEFPAVDVNNSIFAAAVDCCMRGCHAEVIKQDYCCSGGDVIMRAHARMRHRVRQHAW
uniref:Secreted protein n=1 Tax=Panagrellus redivivus TaxID=6233 RepID=A0A7E4ZZS3_PANRE